MNIKQWAEQIQRRLEFMEAHAKGLGFSWAKYWRGHITIETEGIMIRWEEYDSGCCVPNEKQHFVNFQTLEEITEQQLSDWEANKLERMRRFSNALQEIRE